MRAMVVEVVPEIEQFIFEIYRRPEQCVIQTLASNGADLPFDERVRQGNAGDALDLLPPESADWLAIGGTYKEDRGRS